MTGDIVFEQLVDGLRLQAAGYAVQRRALPDYVHLPDELLNAVYTGSFPQLLANGRIPEEARAAFADYERFLDSHETSELGYDASLEEVKNGVWFNELRHRAKGLLRALGKDESKPSMHGTTYVRGA